MKSPLGLSFALSAAVASVFLFAASSAQATTYVYGSNGTTNWSTATWTPGVPTSSLDNILSLTVSSNARNTTNNIASGFQLNGLALTNNSSNTNGQRLAVAGSSLNFVKDSSNVAPTITIAKTSNGGGDTIISIPFTVTDALTITSTANTSTPNAGSPNANTITISGAITNTGGITFDGAGTNAITLGTGVISGAGGITYGGSYIVTASGANTYTGGTTINTRLKIGNAKALGGNTSAASVTNGGALDLNGTTMTNTNALTLNGTGISSGGALANGSATAATYIGLVTLGSASSIVASSGNIILSNTGTIAGSGFGLTLDGTTTGSSIAGIIGTGAGTVTKQGTGTWTLSAANTYTGLTTVSAGALNIGSAGSLNSGNALTVGASGTADFANAGQTLGAVSNANTATNALNFSAATGTVTLASLSGAGNTRFGSNGTVTGGISSGTVTSVGNLTAAISGGTTTVGGVATIGTMSAGTANLNGATSAITTLNGGTINLGSSTALTVSNGSTSGTITGGGSLIKTSGGTLTVSGANTFTGTTTVSAGTLNLGVVNAINNSATNAITLGGGTLQSAFSQSLGLVTLSLTASTASTLDLSTGGTFVFADSSSATWGSGSTLSIVGTFTNTSVRFGGSSAGLTGGQLAQVTINGLAASIDSGGFIVSAIPEPSTYAAIFGAVILGAAAYRRRRSS